MTAWTLGAAAPAAALTGIFAALALLLLSLNLRSNWSWAVKSTVIALALPTTAYIHLAIQAQLGWPSQNGLPELFQLHAALVDEPTVGENGDGAIFLWLTPWDQAFLQDEMEPMEDADIDAMPLSAHRPRAFDLPYSRELHQEVQNMQERLARGEMVVGRHEPSMGWQRRFGGQHGSVALEAPPPPPLPAKDG